MIRIYLENVSPARRVLSFSIFLSELGFVRFRKKRMQDGRNTGIALIHKSPDPTNPNSGY
jgi:hypothetical protein